METSGANRIKAAAFFKGTGSIVLTQDMSLILKQRWWSPMCGATVAVSQVFRAFHKGSELSLI